MANITDATLDQMHYLLATLIETLRLYPAIPSYLTWKLYSFSILTLILQSATTCFNANKSSIKNRIMWKWGYHMNRCEKDCEQSYL